MPVLGLLLVDCSLQLARTLHMQLARLRVLVCHSAVA